jgi:hypothetical protein
MNHAPHFILVFKNSGARIAASVILAAVSLLSGCATAVSRAAYCPPKGAWERKSPAEVGFDATQLAQTIAWAQTQPTDWPADFSTQTEIFGKQLGPVPKSRAAMNGIILRHGYIVAEFGDVEAVDPSYSMAKSYLSTILGLTIDRRMIGDVHDEVGLLVKDGGYESPHNSKVTWKHHVTQSSEWQGELFAKSTTFVGKEEYGHAATKPRDIHAVSYTHLTLPTID